MPKAELKHKNERFESLFRRFKKSVENDDLVRECRKREHFEKKSETRKRAKAAAKKRWQKKVEQQEAQRGT